MLLKTPYNFAIWSLNRATVYSCDSTNLADF